MSDAAWLMGYFGALAEDGDAEADGDGTISRNGHMAGANPESGVDCGSDKELEQRVRRIERQLDKEQRRSKH